MHYHLEIVMPPTNNVEAAVTEILNPFNENSSYEDDEDFSGRPFWDFWVIGGRWSGIKLEEKVGREKIEAFIDQLNEMKITVSGLQFGKQEISPADQIPKVDALWNQLFPDSGTDKCPLFKHSGAQVKYDICELKDVPGSLSCSRFILATEGYPEGTLMAKYMIEDSIWNGVIHVDTGWDGSFKSALEKAAKKTERYKEEYREKYTPKDDWLCVTVDYHS